MSVTLTGTVPVYHYSKTDLGDEVVLDPRETVNKRSFYSRREYSKSSFPRVFYYKDLSKVEDNIKSPHLYVGKVDGSRILNLNELLYEFKELKTSDTNAYEVAIALKGNGYWNDFDNMFRVASKYYDGVFYTSGGIPMINLFKPLKVKKNA